MFCKLRGNCRKSKTVVQVTISKWKFTFWSHIPDMIKEIKLLGGPILKQTSGAQVKELYLLGILLQQSRAEGRSF